MKVVFLGTGTSIGVPVINCSCAVCCSSEPKNRRSRPSIAVEAEGSVLIVDTSVDFRQQVLRNEIRRVDAILYTHAHADHLFGLDDVRIFNYWQQASIPCYGSNETLDKIRLRYDYIFEEAPEGVTRPSLELHPIETPFQLHGVKVTPVPVMHGDLPIFGYRFNDMAYITDASLIPDESYALLVELDLLVLNALQHESHPTHFSLNECLTEIEKINPRVAYLTHMTHEFDHHALSAETPERVQPAYDGLRISL